MAIGTYKIHGKPNLILVDFGNASHHIDEYTYRRHEYLPQFDDLPWGDAPDPRILLIDVMPKRA